MSPVQYRNANRCEPSTSAHKASRDPGNLLKNTTFMENSVDRRAWWATVHGVSESDRTEHTHIQKQTFTKKKKMRKRKFHTITE